MLFKVNLGENDPNFCLVYGVYLHGKLEAELGFDTVTIEKSFTDPFKLVVNESSGFNGVKVDIVGREKQALLYAWKSNMGVQLVANPTFSNYHFRGLIVDPDDTDAVEYAKKRFDEKEQFL